MSPDETLIYESRVRQRQVAVAIVAGLCLIIASVIQLSGPHTKVDELTLDLLVANQRFPLDLISSVINAIGSLAIAWTLLFLFRAARARNPDKARPYVRMLTLVGGGLAAWRASSTRSSWRSRSTSSPPPAPRPTPRPTT